MPYYNDERIPFLLDGLRTMMTEEQAEEQEMDGRRVVPVFDVEGPLPDEAADDYLEHTCGLELPDGRTFGTCKLCELVQDEEIPFE